MPDLVLIRAEEGDWEGLYEDGELLAEGHSLDWPWCLQEVGIDIQTRRIDFDKNNLGRCPYQLSELDGIEAISG